jgi:hypothetical protein
MLGGSIGVSLLIEHSQFSGFHPGVDIQKFSQLLIFYLSVSHRCFVGHCTEAI